MPNKTPPPKPDPNDRTPPREGDPEQVENVPGREERRSKKPAPEESVRTGRKGRI
jgi:hypothetical protein